MDEQEMLLKYIHSITKPLVGKRSVKPRTLLALCDAGFKVSQPVSIESARHSGDAWLTQSGAGVQIGYAVARRMRNGHVVRFANVVNLTLSDEIQFRNWRRSRAIDLILSDLSIPIQMFAAA